MSEPRPGGTGPWPDDDPAGAAADAGSRDPASRTTARTRLNIPHPDDDDRRPRRDRTRLWITLGAIAAALILLPLAFLFGKALLDSSHGGGEPVTVNVHADPKIGVYINGVTIPNGDTPRYTTGGASSKATPAPSPSPSATASSTASPSPSPSYTPSMGESEYAHWISPGDLTKACHEQASPDSSAVFQPELYQDGHPFPQDIYCQDVQGETPTSWYSAATAQPLGPDIQTAPGVLTLDLNRFCQFTWGQSGSGQWQAEDGPYNRYAYIQSNPPNGNPVQKLMCYEVPNSGGT